MKTFKSLCVATICLALSASLSAAPASNQKKAPVKSKPAATKPAAKQSNSKIIPLDRIAAIVNNDVVTEMELQQRVYQAAYNLRLRKIALPPMEAMRDQMLERIIMERIIEQKAKETGIRVDDNMLNGAIEQIANNNHLTVPQLEQRLAQEGVSFKSFRSEVRSQILLQRLRERDVEENIKIPESEVDQYIKDQLGPERRREYLLSRIVVPIPENAQPAQLEEAQKKANRALQAVLAGGDFGKLAAQYSSAPEAMDGGNMGWKSASTFPQTLFDNLKGKKKGDIIPIRVGNAFHIYKLMDSRDPGEEAEVGAVEQARVRHIMLRPTEVTPEDVVIKRLQEMKGRIESGQADFQTLARLHSADPSGTKGGDLGWLYPGDAPPALEEEIAKLQKGQISEPVKSPAGWHIVQLLDRRTQQGVNERIRMQAIENLREQKLQDAVIDWERQMRDEAFVQKWPGKDNQEESDKIPVKEISESKS